MVEILCSVKSFPFETSKFKVVMCLVRTRTYVHMITKTDDSLFCFDVLCVCTIKYLLMDLSITPNTGDTYNKMVAIIICFYLLLINLTCICWYNISKYLNWKYFNDRIVFALLCHVSFMIPQEMITNLSIFLWLISIYIIEVIHHYKCMHVCIETMLLSLSLYCWPSPASKLE